MKEAIETLAGPRSLGQGPPRWLADVAVRDPRLAYCLTRMSGAVGVDGCLSFGSPEIINVVGRFDSGSAGTTVQAQVQGLLDADLWIHSITYTVRRPNAFAGNILKSVSDFFNAKNPNIDFELIINSFCRYLIAATPTPLENLPMIFDCSCPVGMVLSCASSIKGHFTLNRNLAPSEIPTEVIISLIAMRLPTGVYGGCTNSVAIAALREYGLILSEPSGIPPC